MMHLVAYWSLINSKSPKVYMGKVQKGMFLNFVEDRSRLHDASGRSYTRTLKKKKKKKQRKRKKKKKKRK